MKVKKAIRVSLFVAGIAEIHSIAHALHDGVFSYSQGLLYMGAMHLGMRGKCMMQT